MVTGSDEDEVWSTMRMRRKPEVQSDDWNDVRDYILYFERELLMRSGEILLVLFEGMWGNFSVNFRAILGLLLTILQ
jgi:hypothetical protein